MAVRKITNISSGVYTREIDLTLAIQAAGTFAGAAIGLTEKGPAFEVMVSSSFDERRLRLGDLNPNFPTSYYALEFLEQAQNYKEVRILGLEGYKDSKGFVILYDIPGGSSAPAVIGVSPVIADLETLAVVLKPRRSDIIGDPNKVANRVEVLSSPTPTDELFTLLITLVDTTTVTVQCSLRPDAKEYISKVFGEDPRDKTLVQGQASPLWVEFVLPSVKTKTSAAGIPAYFYPGQAIAQTSLNLISGDMTIDEGFLYPTTAISNVTATLSNVIVDIGTPPGGLTPPINTGDLIDISGVVGTGNMSAVNSTWQVGTIVGNTFHILDPVTAAEITTISGSYTSGGTVRLHYSITWEGEVLELGGSTTEIPFQTPITPWFVSDFDVNGEVKRLFRFFSISDGESANTEIKVEIRNLNPAGNNGKGSFDVIVREFSDREDGQEVVLEGFTNLTMDPANANYIVKRIGDGENFELQSRFLFIDLNTDDVLSNDLMPYGVEGFPNITGIKMPDLVWTTNYNFGKSLNKQVLGLANNATNMFVPVTRDNLSFKNVSDVAAATGIGFHLNPLNNLVFNPALWSVVNQEVYQVNPPTNTNTVTPTVKVQRSHFVVDFYGGFDAFNVYAQRDWNTTTSFDFQAFQIAVDTLNDPESIDADFSVLVTPDINFQDHPAAAETVLEMVQTRGDALYIFDFRYDTEASAQSAADDLNFSNMKSSFAATYFPHVQIEDTVNNINVWLPPSIISLATIASTATNEQVWQPPAGSLRTVTQHLIRTRKRMRLADREILKGANIDPITLFPGSGFEITESRTTQDFLSALSFIHNRLLLGFAKKALNQTLRPLLHQLNGQFTKNAFVNTVTPIFDRIKKLNGVEDFKVVVLSTSDDRTTLNGQIEIVPLYPVERIIVDFVLNNSGVQFTQ